MKAIYFSVEAILNGFLIFYNTLKSLGNLCIKVILICSKKVKIDKKHYMFVKLNSVNIRFTHDPLLSITQVLFIWIYE